jgi:nondiscriminating aspartyl-tRNA synthetase
MIRTLVSQTPNQIGQTVLLQGWVNTRRDHGKIVFIDLRDRTGLIQLVLTTDQADHFRSEDVLSVTGIIKSRPDKLVNPKLSTGAIEVEVHTATRLSHSAELPFDMGDKTLNVQLPTLLDYRSLTLRHPSVKAIFEVQAAVATAFRQAATAHNFLEIFPPTVSASSTEGGAEVLKVDYFGHSAFMVQSPQLYKQMLVGAFERVFIISHIYRAEPSVTTRHLVESVQLDCEMGFISSFSELLTTMESIFASTVQSAQTACQAQLDYLGVTPSLVSQPVPRLTLRQAQTIILDRTGIDHTAELDLTPEDEKEICKWAHEVHGSDFITITHFPTKKRAFYSLPDPDNPEFSLSYDLLYKGLEICSGAQRIHSYDQLVEVIKSRGMDPKNFEMYLQAFRFGMPPHGGFSFGLERTTMKLLDLANIREASLYPRDMERVDFHLA